MAAVRCAEADGAAGPDPEEPDLTEPFLPELDLRPEPFPPGPGLAAWPRGGVEGCDPDTI